MRKIIFLFAVSLVMLGSSVYAQDPQFTQFYANPLYLNPAFAGTARCPRIIMNYRNEWPGLSGQFVTYSASYDQHVDALQGGLGLLVTSDQAGGNTLTTTNISGIYSYQLNVTRELSIKAGVEAMYHQKSLHAEQLKFGDMIDRRRGFIYDTKEQVSSNTVSRVDFSAGLLAYSKKYFVGFAAHHLTEPDESLISGTSKLPRKYTGHAGAVIPLGGKSSESHLSPNIIYQKQQDFEQVNLGLFVKKQALVAGIWYRNKDAIIVLLGVQQGLFKLGYSYDVTVSKLTQATYGSHEISFAMQFDCKPKKKKFRTISCPSF